MASKKERRASSHEAMLRRFPKGGEDPLGRVTMLGDSFGRVGAQNLGSKAKARTFKRFSVHN